MSQNFYIIVIARFFFVFGVAMQAVMMGWQMYDLTKDPMMLGLVGLAEAVPGISFALVSGLIVDRHHPLWIYRGMIFLCALSMVMAWVANTPEELFLAAFLTGVARAFTGPAMNVMIPNIVDREEIKRSSAWTTLAFKGAIILGPASAGMILGYVGYSPAYGLALGMLVIALLVLTKLRYKKKASQMEMKQQEKILDQLLVGIRYVWNTPVLFSAMALDMFAVLFGGVTAILPMYADQVLHLGPEGLGWLRAAPAFGALIMSAVLIRKPISKHAGRLFLISVFAYGLTIIGFGFSRVFWLSFLMLALGGAFDAISMVVRGAIVQLLSPDELRGRIASVNTIFISSSNEIGAFESGVAASAMGLVPSIYFGGAMTILVVSFFGWKVKRWWTLHLDQLEK